MSEFKHVKSERLALISGFNIYMDGVLITQHCMTRFVAFDELRVWDAFKEMTWKFLDENCGDLNGYRRDKFTFKKCMVLADLKENKIVSK